MTSKLGLPEVSSMTAFCRCCCSGMTSDSTLIPVRSVNSDAYFCSNSPLGPLIRLASIVVPAYFFHCGSARAGNPERPSAPAAAVPARTARRETRVSLYGLCQGGVSLGDRSAHLFSFVSFFVRSESPFLRPDLHLACRWRAQKLSRLAVAPTLSDKLRRCQATP